MDRKVFEARFRALGMTPGSLARIMEVSPVTVWRWRTGRAKVRHAEVAMRLAGALGVAASTLFPPPRRKR